MKPQLPSVVHLLQKVRRDGVLSYEEFKLWGITAAPYQVKFAGQLWARRWAKSWGRSGASYSFGS